MQLRKCYSLIKVDKRMKRGWFSGMSCPKCSRLFSENELVKVLEGAGVSEKTIKKVREDIAKKQVSEEL